MKRTILHQLKKWQNDPSRKPLLIRGARQVGKTFIIRELARHFPDFVEINFELRPEAIKIFDHDLDPVRITRDLGLLIGKKIIPGETLLFFDEIQDAPKAITALRYYYEILPEIHVIAAGSLLEFELEKTGMPVGRISSMYMYPLSFMEFLKARNEDLLIETLLNHHVVEQLSEVVHRKFLLLLGEYLTVGGMPEVVKCFIDSGDLFRCFNIQRTIVDTFRQDFRKYALKYQLQYVELLFNSIPSLLGQKFKFSGVPGEYRKRELAPCLELLLKAYLAHKITHSSGQGIPLAAQVHPESFKINFLDVALSQTLLGVDPGAWILTPDINFINKGPITEALVGQELLAYMLPERKNELYYWHREARSSNAEVDYLLQQEDRIIPLEVKSGATGKLKSLRMFLENYRHSPYGIRFSTANFSAENGIYHYPLYAVAKVIPQSIELIQSLF